MNISDFDYDLPEALIAQEPLEDRAASRLLHIDPASGSITHRQFRDVTQILRPGDLLVVNSTRVTALRIFGQRETGGNVEALLLSEAEPGVFHALMKPAKRLRLGTKIQFEGDLVGEIIGLGDDGHRTIRFAAPNFRETLAEIGLTPLPPYITTHLADPDRYQTVYANTGGSAAAPTAGLHFTQDLLVELTQMGIGFAQVSLSVSIDTFRPMMVDRIVDHVMHGEVCEISEETAEAIARAQGRIIAVGTTTVRTLESFATAHRRVQAGKMNSKLFISPGYEFRVIDGMFTNFHMPRTTMMLMISALAGTDIVRQAYAEAIEERYRFLSFGDSMLIL